MPLTFPPLKTSDMVSDVVKWDWKNHNIHIAILHLKSPTPLQRLGWVLVQSPSKAPTILLLVILKLYVLLWWSINGLTLTFTTRHFGSMQHDLWQWSQMKNNSLASTIKLLLASWIISKSYVWSMSSQYGIYNSIFRSHAYYIWTMICLNEITSFKQKEIL